MHRIGGLHRGPRLLPPGAVREGKVAGRQVRIASDSGVEGAAGLGRLDGVLAHVGGQPSRSSFTATENRHIELLSPSESPAVNGGRCPSGGSYTGLSKSVDTHIGYRAVGRVEPDDHVEVDGATTLELGRSDVGHPVAPAALRLGKSKDRGQAPRDIDRSSAPELGDHRIVQHGFVVAVAGGAEWRPRRFIGVVVTSEARLWSTVGAAPFRVVRSTGGGRSSSHVDGPEAGSGESQEDRRVISYRIRYSLAPLEPRLYEVTSILAVHGCAGWAASLATVSTRLQDHTIWTTSAVEHGREFAGVVYSDTRTLQTYGVAAPAAGPSLGEEGDDVVARRPSCNGFDDLRRWTHALNIRVGVMALCPAWSRNVPMPTSIRTQWTAADGNGRKWTLAAFPRISFRFGVRTVAGRHYAARPRRTRPGQPRPSTSSQHGRFGRPVQVSKSVDPRGFVRIFSTVSRWGLDAEIRTLLQILGPGYLGMQFSPPHDRGSESRHVISKRLPDDVVVNGEVHVIDDDPHPFDIAPGNFARFFDHFVREL